MKTKIVYTLISSKNDIYLEQMWLSIYSLRIYNPTSFIMVLVDKNTYSYLTEKTSLIPLINQIKIIDVPNNYSAKEKSRYLKTSVRQNVSGPCLFLDTDTIITSSLTELDDLKVDIACVPDLHTTFNEFPGKDGIIHLVKKIFDIFLKARGEIAPKARNFNGEIWHGISIKFGKRIGNIPHYTKEFLMINHL